MSTITFYLLNTIGQLCVLWQNKCSVYTAKLRIETRNFLKISKPIQGDFQTLLFRILLKISCRPKGLVYSGIF